MIIKFFNAEDRLVEARLVEASDDWVACELGHCYLRNNDPNGAVDFDIVLPEEDPNLYNELRFDRLAA